MFDGAAPSPSLVDLRVRGLSYPIIFTFLLHLEEAESVTVYIPIVLSFVERVSCVFG